MKKKKKNFAQTAAMGGAEKKRVDIHHNASSPSREQHEGHDEFMGTLVGKWWILRYSSQRHTRSSQLENIEKEAGKPKL